MLVLWRVSSLLLNGDEAFRSRAGRGFGLATGHTDMRKGFDGLALLVQETLKRTMLRHALPMPNQSVAVNVHSTMRILPTPQPSDASDPVPAMRREISLLRIELEQLRAMESEARKTNEFLVAHFDRIIDNRDRWQREAERLGAWCSVHEETLNKPRWSLFWFRR